MRSPGIRRQVHRAWLLAAVGLAAISAACGSEATTAMSPTQAKCQVALDAPSSNVGADGGAATLTVTTAPECPWDVSAGVPWLSGWTPASGQGSGSVQFRVAANPLPAVREGDVIVNDRRLTVSQQGAPCQIDVRPATLAVHAPGGTQALGVSAPGGCAWQASADASWLSIPAGTGSGPGTVAIIVAPNPDAAARSGTVTVGDRRIGVTQAGMTPAPSCRYATSTAAMSIAAGGDTGSVLVSADPGCGWTARSATAWIAVAAGASGSGPGVVTFSVAANSGGTRIGSLAVAGHTVTITQAGASAAPCTYGVSTTRLALDWNPGKATLDVSAGGQCAWTAASQASWITIAAGATGSGNGSVSLKVEKNPGAARAGTLVVAGVTVTVDQRAK